MSRIVEGNPRQVRAHMQNAYDSYAQGIDEYPRIKLTGDFTTDSLPKKSVHAATLLIAAWQGIKEDLTVFDACTHAIAREVAV